MDYQFKHFEGTEIAMPDLAELHRDFESQKARHRERRLQKAKFEKGRKNGNEFLTDSL